MPSCLLLTITMRSILLSLTNSRIRSPASPIFTEFAFTFPDDSSSISLGQVVQKSLPNLLKSVSAFTSIHIPRNMRAKLVLSAVASLS